MPPRSAKTKKNADVKIADSEAPKKGRGKAKVVEDIEQEEPELDIDDKAIVPEKKTKRGKKANGTTAEIINGEDSVPPAKRGRKKVVEEPVSEEKVSDEENSVENENDVKENSDSVEVKDDESSEDAPIAASKGRKKPVKKEDKTDTKPAAKGKKAKQNGDTEVEAKPKGKGRGRKAKEEAEPEEDKANGDEEIKTEAPVKGKKRGGRAAKEKTPESEKEDETANEETEEKPVDEPKKKETKGKKGQGKKESNKTDADDVVEVKEEPASKKRKVTKKEEKPKDIDKEEDEEPIEAKPKGKRGAKKAAAGGELAEESPELSEGTKRRRKLAEDKAPIEDAKKKAPPKNKSTTNYEEIDFSSTSKTSQGKEWNFKIASWNVDGIRAWMGKGGLDYIQYEKPDILCLQETKCSQEKLPAEATSLPGYHAYWLGSDKDGYAGVAVYTTKLAISVQYGLQDPELDSEGRIITAEYEQFYLICTYVPNAGRGLVTLPKRLQWNDEFRKHVKELDKKKPVIICGDMNVAHNEIDLANPKTNKKNAGFTPEERAGMTDLLTDGFVDTYRHLYPDKIGAYTFWTYMSNSRAKNVGWRLDYFLVSERLLSAVCENVIRDQVYGSDHCPLALFLHLTTAAKPKE